MWKNKYAHSQRVGMRVHGVLLLLLGPPFFNLPAERLPAATFSLFLYSEDQNGQLI
jgi:hypothetical protein